MIDSSYLKMLSLGKSRKRWAATAMLLGITLMTLTGTTFLFFSSPLHKKKHHSKTPFAQKIPSLQETVDLAQLSHAVYHLKHPNMTCQDFEDPTHSDFLCHWYHHEWELGTQLLLLESKKRKQIVVAFAGTDDLRTSLEDANLLMKPFGDNSTISLGLEVEVHAGFDNAVFSHSVYQNLTQRLDKLLLHSKSRKGYQLITTGHSLGAANAILVAVALTAGSRKEQTQTKQHKVKCVTFGAPKTGNLAWKDYFNGTLFSENDTLSLWRVVLGWDLVPRLPELFSHVGHTIQIWSGKDNKTQPEDTRFTSETKENPGSSRLTWNGFHDSNSTVDIYYHHYGDEASGYGGVPSEWNSKPYYFVPGALLDHSIAKYVSHLLSLQEEGLWADMFAPVEPPSPSSLDDDKWVNPPDDEYPPMAELPDLVPLDFER